ncbi:MAG: polysaccharide deacetylase family protein [Oscillospiraceae bacterium]|nr:polysaccharide deacetylase family protein [Oscillospiraceae bacterium]
MIIRCYPNGKSKAFNITYDDGILQDVRFVALLNRYGIKGTFNLNSQLMEQEFEWVHETGMVVKRLSIEAVRHLYDGHEIASHTLTHPYLSTKTREEILWEMGEDKRRLEELFGREVAGFGVPFHFYDETVYQCVKECGFEYGRNSELTHNYFPWQDPYFWSCGIFHLEPELDSFVDGFFATDEELALCQIVGHSYDLDAAQLWEKMEQICRRVAEDEDVLPMTHLQIVRYLRAMKQAQITDSGIYNPSVTPLWFRVDGEVVRLLPGERYERSKQ